MIIVQGLIPIVPEQRDEALELLRWMTQETLQEDGCISYEFFVSLSDANTVLLMQEWENLATLNAHYQTEHMAAFMKALPDLLRGEIRTRRFAVQESEPPAEPPPIIH